MNLLLEREVFTDDSTIGRLYVDGVFFCFTLEDADRRLEDGTEKIPGKTAIPRGTYKVIINWSNRFNKELPLIQDVPNYAGVRIHSGNTPDDTEGCILVGSCTSKDFVGNSRATFTKLFNILDSAYATDEGITLEIK